GSLSDADSSGDSPDATNHQAAAPTSGATRAIATAITSPDDGMRRRTVDPFPGCETQGTAEVSDSSVERRGISWRDQASTDSLEDRARGCSRTRGDVIGLHFDHPVRRRSTLFARSPREVATARIA